MKEKEIIVKCSENYLGDVVGELMATGRLGLLSIEDEDNEENQKVLTFVFIDKD